MCSAIMLFGGFDSRPRADLGRFVWGPSYLGVLGMARQ